MKFTPSARLQFLEGLEFILQENPTAARRVYEKSSAALRGLVDFPSSGRVVPEFPELPYREVIVSPYRFFYRIDDNTIWVIAVWHRAQLPGPPEKNGGATD